MAIKGSLKEASLADVCQLLAMGQKTGCLSVTDRSRFGQIYFERGRITYARILNRRDRLGDLLVREGKLTDEQVREVLDVQVKQPDRRLGEILVAGGYIGEDALAAVIRLQIEEAIYHLFTWTRGSFYFEVDERPDAGELLVSLNPESLLLEAARRVDEWSLIEKKIPTLDLLFDVERERLRGSGVELTFEQEQILPLLDGIRTVQEVADDTGLSEFDVGKALFGLIQAGFAHRVGRRVEEKTRVRESELAERRNLGIAFCRTGMLDEAVRAFRRVLELDQGDVVAHYHLGIIALREGRHRDAIAEFRSVVDERGPHFGAFVNMAYALRRLGRPNHALLVLDQAEALRPGTPMVPLARAVAQLAREDAAGAAESCAEYRRRLAPSADPGPVYFYYAALVAAVSGKLDEAAATAAEGLGLHPGTAPLLMLAGAIAERRGYYDEAEKAYRQAAEESPAQPQVYKNLGDVAYRRGLYDEAADHFRRAVELAPELGDDVCAKLGNLYFKRMQREQALEWWRRALELNPDNRVVKSNLEVVAHAG